MKSNNNLWLYMKFILFFALLLLPTAAQTQEQQSSDCLIAGQTARISGKMVYMYDDELTPVARTGYVIELLRPNCFVYDKSDSGGYDLDGPVEAVQVYVNDNSTAPRLGRSLATLDNNARKKRLNAYLRAMAGKYVEVTGEVVISIGPRTFTTLIMPIISISPCETSPTSKKIDKC